MNEPFTIQYKGQTFSVKESWKEDRALFTVEIGGEAHIFSMGENGSWQAHPGLPFDKVQEIGRLIERATS